MCMRRINIFLEKEQIDFLNKLPGTLSDNVRQFVSKCISEIKTKSVSESKSKKVGEENE